MKHEKALFVALGILCLLLILVGTISFNIIRSQSATIDNLRLQRDGRSELIVALESRLGDMELRIDRSRTSIEEGLRSLEEDIGRAVARQDRYQRDKEIIAAIGKAVDRFTKAKNDLTEE